ncbi:MAG: Idi2: isopentenyl-diphosphate delta-isomerase [Candidatus Gottesmanbacteria bacterium GW2011_GWA2_41_12]|uniref:Isopentenyl-diphosphate delta-isomerase n=1 Tax=Candidatus Gottesmanbacteria bacterium GW2011_GWA2_41_12 TaxID=1618440 RepID=A0A0G0UI03_9BACT|nr:MAG: Idi2: isopentenyl-diphosphate delta-isomerase [Candidatus Gottesmanbacteria bacterium GW2011_GWA2_41_12]
MEQVVLVDDKNNEIGTADKETIHSHNTPLHRGFSLFLFNSKKQLLLTKRASTKKTFPGVWTNTVCGHPGRGESVEEATARRLKYELGIILGGSHPSEGETLIRKVSNYRYKFADKNGIEENEICPILIAYSDEEPKPNKEEIDDWKWMDREIFLEEIKRNPAIYSPWCIQEADLLYGFVKG